MEVNQDSTARINVQRSAIKQAEIDREQAKCLASIEEAFAAAFARLDAGQQNTPPSGRKTASATAHT